MFHPSISDLKLQTYFAFNKVIDLCLRRRSFIKKLWTSSFSKVPGFYLEVKFQNF